MRMYPSDRTNAKHHLVPVLALALASTLGFPGNATAEDGKPETRIYTFPTCPATGPDVYKDPAGAIGGLAPLVAALVSAVVSPLIEGVVDKGVNALKEAAKDKDFPIASPDPVMKEFYQVGLSGETALNRQIGCIVLVRAEFETGKFPSGVSKPGDPLSKRIDDKFRVWAGSSATPQPGDDYARVKPGKLEFYFEVVPVVSDDGKTLGLRPQALQVESFASKDGFFGPSRRNYQFTVTFADPFGSTAFASADFKYEGVERGTSKEACVAKPAKTYCVPTELGGIRGWYATKPISDDFAALIKKRQANAVTLKTAVTALDPTPPMPTVPDDLANVGPKLNNYCRELEASNKPRTNGQQWDDACPSTLARAKREYLYEESVAATKLAKQQADEFWSKKCLDPAGAQLAKNDQNMVKCLEALAGTQQLAPAGKFLLTSTIVETRPGNKLAAFLAPAAEKVAPAVKTALKEKFDPVEREKVAVAAASKAVTDAKTKRDALNAITLAEDAVSAAQATYDAAFAKSADAPTDTALKVAALNAHIALVKAQIAANDAYRALDLPIPYPAFG
jgi:hypothetical protein